MFIEKMFIRLLTSLVNASNCTKRVFLKNQQWMIQLSLMSIGYCPFAVNFYRYVGSCNALNDLSNRVYVPNKTEGLSDSNGTRTQTT